MRSFRFRITDGEVSPPPEGTVLRLVPWTNSGTQIPADTAVVRDGAVVVENVGADRVNCFALTPDGAIAKLVARAESRDGLDTSFRRERTIEVLVRDADGKPVAGRYVVARDQGNNAIQPPAPTGDDGRVVFRGLWGYLADLYVLADVRPPAAWGGAPVGSVDLDRGSALLEYTVPREIRVRLLVRIGDRAALPARA